MDQLISVEQVEAMAWQILVTLTTESESDDLRYPITLSSGNISKNRDDDASTYEMDFDGLAEWICGDALRATIVAKGSSIQLVL
jgi:hypothetical protein